MSKNSGVIYDLGNGRYGLALNSQQLPAFTDYKKVYLHVFLDPQCTIAEKNPNDGKNYVTLKHISTIKQIGFQD